MVIAELTASPAVDAPIGCVVEVLGDAADPGIEIEIALRKHDLPFEFTQARGARFADSGEERQADFPGRMDLRALPLVTIDGETAKDFDDAVYCEAARGRLPAGGRDRRRQPLRARRRRARSRVARARQSVYFPRRVIPMLPERLSNGLCSINPDVDRLCVACDMSVTASGEIRAIASTRR